MGSLKTLKRRTQRKANKAREAGRQARLANRTPDEVARDARWAEMTEMLKAVYMPVIRQKFERDEMFFRGLVLSVTDPIFDPERRKTR